jgi:hypothetical protein
MTTTGMTISRNNWSAAMEDADLHDAVNLLEAARRNERRSRNAEHENNDRTESRRLARAQRAILSGARVR